MTYIKNINNENQESNFTNPQKDNINIEPINKNNIFEEELVLEKGKYEFKFPLNVEFFFSFIFESKIILLNKLIFSEFVVSKQLLLIPLLSFIWG